MTSGVKAPKTKLFVAAYGTAYAGATIAFVPLLALILPLKAEAIAPTQKLQLLSLALLAGAITASIANILAGWLSDRIFARNGSRIGQIAIGLLAIQGAYWMFAQSSSWETLIGATIVFQFSLNLMFSPLGALLADKVPHRMKGRAAALTNLGIPIGTLMIALLALLQFDGVNTRLLIVGFSTVILITPVLLVAQQLPNLASHEWHDPALQHSAKAPDSDFVFAWIARFSIQVSGAVIFGYLIYYLQDVVPDGSAVETSRAEHALGQMNLAAAPLAIAIGLATGFLADRSRRRKSYLIAHACIVGASLGVLSLSGSVTIISTAYVIFISSLTAYLAMDSAIVTQLLASSQTRARTLGMMNLANAFPSILAPGLALFLSVEGLTKSVLTSLLWVACGLALAGAAAAAQIRSIR